MHISAFDLDHTLLKANGSFRFGQYLFRQKEFTFLNMVFLVLCYLGTIAGLLSLKRLHKINFSVLFKGKSRPYFQSLLSQFLDKELDNLLYRPVFEELQRAQQAGHCTTLLSSSPDFLVEAVAGRLGIMHCGATQYLVDEHGYFTAVGTMMDGVKKADVLLELAKSLNVSKKDIRTYSDSHLDLPFIEVAGHPIAVRPNRQLRKIAIQKGWKILK